MRIAAASMVRNEVDIIKDFLNINSDMFDMIFIADMLSTDGTTELISHYIEAGSPIHKYTLPYLAKYQSEAITELTRLAFSQGADWVFPIDADEFLHVESRKFLEDLLENWGSPVMHLPWLNLIPIRYGSFTQFEFLQEYRWSGNLSKFKKVAISRNYFVSNPNFQIDPGNHNVRPSIAEEAECERIGIQMMHIPARSAKRAIYKANNALRLQKNKHNQQSGEGLHHLAIAKYLSGRFVNDGVLNDIAHDYGNVEITKAHQLARFEWPIAAGEKLGRTEVDVSVTTVDPRRDDNADEKLPWALINQPKFAPLYAAVEGMELKLRPQPMKGTGQPGPKYFALLPSDAGSLSAIDSSLLVKAAFATHLPPPLDVPSGWTDLVPALGALMAIIRPRRFVELGTHNGMSYFSACNFSKVLGIHAECIAVDSWVGDEHAGIHDSKVFFEFKENLRSTNPEQIYVHTYFDEAAHIFENESIDLLHIDGFHSYDSVRHDFDTWRGKLSDRGIVMFHDINVHERAFGVWRFWNELKVTYPCFEFGHGHGLGIVYLGVKSGTIWHAFDWLSQNPNVANTVQIALEDQAGVNRKTEEEISRVIAQLIDRQEEVARISEELRRVRANRDSYEARPFRILSEAVQGFVRSTFKF